MGSGPGTRARPLIRVPVPAGPAGLAALQPYLRAALDGTGPAIVPVPVVGMTVSSQFVQRVLDATRPDDPDAPLEDDEIAVVMPTSGSTGNPRGVLHTTASLHALSDEVNEGGQPQWIAALPLTSIGGFNVALRAWYCGVDPIALPSIGGAAAFTPEAFAVAVAEAGCRCDDVRVSLVAAQLRRLLADDAGAHALARCRQVLVGAGPVPSATVQAAHESGVALTRTYGATETAGGCVYQGRPLPGVGVRIDPGSRRPGGTEVHEGELHEGELHEGSDGEVILSGPMLARGYRLQPALTAQRFTPDGYRTTDLGRWVDGCLSITGRMDDVVIIAGVNVSVGAVESVIAELPDIAACAVVAIGQPGGEPELAAMVVLRDGQAGGDGTSEASRGRTELIGQTERISHTEHIRQAVRTQLGGPAVPRRIGFADELPSLPSGKPDRALIIDQARRRQGCAWQP